MSENTRVFLKDQQPHAKRISVKPVRYRSFWFEVCFVLKTPGFLINGSGCKCEKMNNRLLNAEFHNNSLLFIRIRRKGKWLHHMLEKNSTTPQKQHYVQ